jgi:hypothetical protein
MRLFLRITGKYNGPLKVLILSQSHAVHHFTGTAEVMLTIQ